MGGSKLPPPPPPPKGREKEEKREGIEREKERDVTSGGRERVFFFALRCK